MKLKDIIDCNESLKALKDKRLPISVSLIISRNFKKLAPVMEDYEEKRSLLIQRYAKRDENGEMITHKNDSVQIGDPDAFIREMDELTSTEIEVIFDKIPQVSLDRCEEEKYDRLTVDEVGVIDEYMLEDDS